MPIVIYQISITCYDSWVLGSNNNKDWRNKKERCREMKKELGGLERERREKKKDVRLKEWEPPPLPLCGKGYL